MSMKVFECPKCRKRLANRHNLSRHKKNCGKRLQQQLCNAAVEGKPSIHPSLDGRISGSGKSSTSGTDDHPNNPKIDALLDAILSGDRDAPTPTPKKKRHEPIVISSPSKRFDQIYYQLKS